ncbi:iron-containing alcohol dehydrogenase, partial [Acinetobacter sp. RF14B]|uniref:iron-containing alcohol dehydrogenase n=1 Tax=Acinetobacter sp. RF14B TaxID=2650965 RepID=UPI001170B19F
MDRFQFQTVPNIIAGLGAIQELSQILKKGRYERLLLVTDPGMFQHKLHLPILDIVEDAGLNYAIYAQVQADPADTLILEDYARYLQSIQALNVPYYQIPGNHDDARYFPFYRNTDQAHAIRL